jgi:hypothetical protein
VERARGPKTEASEVEVSELPADRQRLIKKLGLKPDVAFSGIHGHIVHFDYPSERIPMKIIKILASDRNVRWVEYVHGALAVGF